MKKIGGWIMWVGLALNGFSEEIFVFNLVNKNGASWDGVSTGVYTNPGTALTLEATFFVYLDGEYSLSSQLNSTAASFGVNAPTTADQSSFFDTAVGKESVWISFNHAVTVKSLVVGDFSLSNVETGAYQVANGTITPFTASGTYSGIDTLLNTGSYFKVMAVNTGGGNGWSLNSFSVTAIPEPTTVMMLGTGSLCLFLARRMFYH